MLNKVLKLEGITILNKKHQSFLNSIRGGQQCRFTIFHGSGTPDRVYAGGYSEGQQGSNEANADCLAVIAAGASRCFYDCAYDGFQSED